MWIESSFKEKQKQKKVSALALQQYCNIDKT